MPFISCELLFHSCDGHIVVAAMPKSNFICHVNSGPKVTVDRFLGVLQVRPYRLPLFPLPDASPCAAVGYRRLLQARRFFSSGTAANDVVSDSIAGCAQRATMLRCCFALHHRCRTCKKVENDQSTLRNFTRGWRYSQMHRAACALH
jgi:hypothetical protein